MIYSMTAFARAETILAPFSAVIEIRAYNSRFLDINLKIPKAYAGLESKIKQFVSHRLVRGRIELQLFLNRDDGQSTGYEVDIAKAASYHHALEKLKERFALAGHIPLDLLAGVEGIIKPVENTPDLKAGWMVTESCLDQALDQLVAMRKTEGDFLRIDFDRRLEFIENGLKKIKAQSDDLVNLYLQRLKERITALIEDTAVSPDPDRLAQEAAILADKSDISEELMRTASHLVQFQHIMDSNEAGGRQLNFLVQEFHREFNTIGAKSANAEISHMIVAIKAELEKLREQVQNIE
jgi:uncharacterized protein (TIGR00255 family)